MNKISHLLRKTTEWIWDSRKIPLFSLLTISLILLHIPHAKHTWLKKCVGYVCSTGFPFTFGQNEIRWISPTPFFQIRSQSDVKSICTLEWSECPLQHLYCLQSVWQSLNISRRDYSFLHECNTVQFGNRKDRRQADIESLLI